MSAENEMQKKIIILSAISNFCDADPKCRLVKKI